MVNKKKQKLSYLRLKKLLDEKIIKFKFSSNVCSKSKSFACDYYLSQKIKLTIGYCQRYEFRYS